jgi:hypothetical protein
MVAASLKHSGVWATYYNLRDRSQGLPEDLALYGYVEILRNVIIRDLLARPKGTSAVPCLAPEFLDDYAKFELNAQEGYLVSLINGQLSIQKLLKVTPFDPVTTLFALARLESVRAISFSS